MFSQLSVLQLPVCDVSTSVVLAMLKYLYTASIESSLGESGCTYANYHISLFHLSLRFYLPLLGKGADEALDQDEIGIQGNDIAGMEELIRDLYMNRQGAKWKAFRMMVMKAQARKLIRMPRAVLDRLEKAYPGSSEDIAEAFRLKLMGGDEKKHRPSSWKTR